MVQLETIAERSISALKEYGAEGITSSVLAEELKIPRRRIYDIIAVLRAAGLIHTKRESKGTKIRWKASLKENGTNSRLPVASSGAGVRAANQVKINSKKIRITPSGIITSINNKGVEVIIESTDKGYRIENID
ncbi:MAG: hypothetical protein ACTSYA_03290 [Candidatus Kariarchaeaceae archaeon]